MLKKRYKLKPLFKHQLLVTSICVFAVVMIFFGSSYAVFSKTKSGNEYNTVQTGDLELSYVDLSDEGNVLTLNNEFPVSDDVGSSGSSYRFSVENTGSIQAEYRIVITDDIDVINSDGCKDNLIEKSNIRYKFDNGKVGTLSDLYDDSVEGYVIYSGILQPTESNIHEIRLWLSENSDNSILGKHYHGKANVVIEQNNLYMDESGANIPELATNMIPVTYDTDKTSWVKADVNTKWYDYEEQWWANAVTVSSTNRQKYLDADYGTEISMDDINTMWVWIPRYEYETITSTTATEIKVNFLKGVESDKTENYITHPAFQFGEDKLKGIWVAKFEASSDTSCTATTGDVDKGCDLTTLKVQIKPNVTSWSGIRVSTLDLNTRSMNDENNVYGFIETEVDAHVMKNLEWGAVAYLSQSKYGKYGNPDYTGTNKEIYQNKSSEYITGMSNGTPSTSTANTQVTYNIEKTGTGASTTGTIYGIYDMSGNAWEYVMGVIKGYNSNNPMSGNSDTYNSGFEGQVYNSGSYINISGRNWPNSKYYDLYAFGETHNDSAAYARYKIGDATTETKSWNGDYDNFAGAVYPWFLRGGYYGNDAKAGVFSFNRTYGDANIGYSFRPTLVLN